ncbi:MAG TPA: DNA methyltransferase [bacterium]|nr:DNA methyltransferase [bacterium]
MMTKEEIEIAKNEGNSSFCNLIERIKYDIPKIIFLLENLGRLPENFDVDIFYQFIDRNNSKIRFWAIKNISKLATEKHIKKLYETAKNDSDSMVRREAVSALGRMRNPNTINYLIEFLNDTDPKIILQSIRGLLLFKTNTNVSEKLKSLINHPNEMIQNVIKKEFEIENIKKPIENHTEVNKILKDTVVNGDTIEIMKMIADESIHLTFTSPPYYNARDYSIYPSYKDYLDFLAKVFKEIYRITKEGRFLIVNTSPIIIPRVSRQHSSIRYPIPFDLHHYLVEMDWEFIDDIVWLKPEASVKDRNGGFKQHRKPLAYKPNAVTEYLMVYRKKTSKLLDWNIRQYDWKTVKESKVLEEYETTNVWKIDPTFNKIHTAVFPIELCKRVIKFYSFKNDLVFDPFAGSGTVAKAAQILNRHFFLTEKDNKYFEYIKNSLSNVSLFEKNDIKFFTIKQLKEALK